MMEYICEIKDQNDSPFQFRLKIKASNKIGEMTWPDSYQSPEQLLKPEKKSDNSEIKCWIKWNYFNVLCWVSVIQQKQKNFLIIVVARKIYTYEIKKKDYQSFLDYLEPLQIPTYDVSTPHLHNENNNKPFRFESNELDSTFVSFYVTKDSFASADINFNKLIVNQRHINIDNPQALPADQGYYIFVGLFKNGTPLELAWEINTGYVSGQQSSSVGIIRNNNLRNYTEIDRFDIETFETYNGFDSVIV